MTSNLIWHLINSHILLSPHLIGSYTYCATNLFTHVAERRTNFRRLNFKFFVGFNECWPRYVWPHMTMFFVGEYLFQHATFIITSIEISWLLDLCWLQTCLTIEVISCWLSLTTVWMTVLGQILLVREAEFLYLLIKWFWRNLTRIWLSLTFWLGMIWLLLIEGKILDLKGLFWIVVLGHQLASLFWLWICIIVLSLSLLNIWYFWIGRIDQRIFPILGFFPGIRQIMMFTCLGLCSTFIFHVLSIVTVNVIA